MCFVSDAYNNVEIRASGNEDKDSKNGCHFHRSRIASSRKKYAYKSKHGNSEIYLKEPIRNKRETTKLILFLKKKNVSWKYYIETGGFFFYPWTISGRSHCSSGARLTVIRNSPEIYRNNILNTAVLFYFFSVFTAPIFTFFKMFSTVLKRVPKY